MRTRMLIAVIIMFALVQRGVFAKPVEQIAKVAAKPAATKPVEKPKKVHEIDHLRLSETVLKVQVQEALIRLAESQIAQSRAEIARLNRQREALLSAFLDQYQIDPRRDSYDTDPSSPAFLTIHRDGGKE